jgi:hypothetical protein
VSQRVVLSCVVFMGAAIFAAYPLSLIGSEGAAGVVFIIAMLVAWFAAAAGFLRKLWD